MTIAVRHELAKVWSAVRTILKAPLDVSDSLRDFDRQLRRDQVKRELADAEKQRTHDDRT